MPSSDPVTIPKILQLVQTLSPRSILDVGCGNGRYGFLFREILDWNQGRLERSSWETRIDAVEVERSYLTPVHGYVYDDVFEKDWMELEADYYDLVFMGDVLEHFSEWQLALSKAFKHASVVLVVAPNWPGSGRQGAWMGRESERHRTELDPGKLSGLGGRFLWANSKAMIVGFGGDLLEGRDVLL